jgi:hypothetical protein
MIEITDEMRAKAARAICRETCAEVGDLPCPDVGSHAECSCWGCADAAITAVAPLIAAAEREACAKEADSHWKGMPFGNADEAAMDAADAIAAAIRARGGAG